MLLNTSAHLRRLMCTLPVRSYMLDNADGGTLLVSQGLICVSQSLKWRPWPRLLVSSSPDNQRSSQKRRTL